MPQATDHDIREDMEHTTDLLNEAPPNCSVEFTEKFIADCYGVETSVKQLACERDQIFLVTAKEGGERYILRFTNPAEDRSVTNFQTEAMLHLLEVSPELPIPRVLTSLLDEAEVEVTLPDGRVSIARAISFLQGVPLAEVPERNPGIRTDMAKTLARMGWAFRGFFHPAAGHVLLWDMKHAASLRAYFGFIKEDEIRHLVTMGLDNYEQNVLSVQKSLRAQVVHNDLNFSNVMIHESSPEITGVLDFGDMVHGPLIYDLAVALAYQFSGPADDALEIIKEFTRDYHQIIPLEKGELEILYDLLVTRQVLTLTITAWRASLYPENAEYILRNHKLARTAILRLSELDRDVVTRALIEACFGDDLPA